MFLKKYNIDNFGYVELVDHMGDDGRVINCARESYGLSEKEATDEKKKTLINNMIKNGHCSPFENVVFQFKLKMPVFVARQWVRHRTGRMNEISARYTEVKPEFFNLDTETICSRNKNISIEKANTLEQKILDIEFNNYENYLNFIKEGIPKELSRTVLPLSMYTEFYWQMDLNNLMKMFDIRIDEHAQYEFRKYIFAIYKIVKHICPYSMDAWLDNRYLSNKFDSNESLELYNTSLHSLRYMIDNNYYYYLNDTDENIRNSIDKLCIDWFENSEYDDTFGFINIDDINFCKEFIKLLDTLVVDPLSESYLDTTKSIKQLINLSKTVIRLGESFLNKRNNLENLERGFLNCK